MKERLQLKDEQIPYFCWDRSWSVAEIQRRLAKAEGFGRDQLMAWIMREAVFSDVWRFFEPKEVYDAFPRIEPFLGKWKDFWKYILRTWHELGKV